MIDLILLQLFTDAGQYVIRFGDADSLPHIEPDSVSATILLAYLRIPCYITYVFSFQIQEFKVARPLSLSERAVTVALAISLDNDYFSSYGGWYANSFSCVLITKESWVLLWNGFYRLFFIVDFAGLVWQIITDKWKSYRPYAHCPCVMGACVVVQSGWDYSLLSECGWLGLIPQGSCGGADLLQAGAVFRGLAR